MTTTETIQSMYAALDHGQRDAWMPLADCLEENGDLVRAAAVRDLPRQWSRAKELLDAASEGAHSRVGHYLGADRLTALRYYAGVIAFSASTGTAPLGQRAKITQKFLELAQAERISPLAVRWMIAIDLGDEGVVYGLHGA